MLYFLAFMGGVFIGVAITMLSVDREEIDPWPMTKFLTAERIGESLIGGVAITLMLPLFVCCVIHNYIRYRVKP